MLKEEKAYGVSAAPSSRKLPAAHICLQLFQNLPSIPVLDTICK